MMKYMLDTNTCIFAIKKFPEVLKHILEQTPGDICISSITYAELCHGVEKSAAIERNRLALLLFLADIPVLAFDGKASEEYGKVRAGLEKKGMPIGSMDYLIAAHAKSLGLVIVTNNTREFERVEGLQIEDWCS